MGRNSCLGSVTTALMAAFACILLMGCTGRSLSPDDLAAVNRGSNALVLLRIFAEPQSGEPPAIFGTFAGEGARIAIGDFDSGGLPRRCPCSFLSEEARARGWIALKLSPGYYYLAIERPYNGIANEPNPLFDDLPRWRIEVPAETRVVYAGTFHLHTIRNPTLFGTHYFIRQGATRIEDEQDEVLTVAHRYLASLPAPTTYLAVLQTGPLLFGIPQANIPQANKKP